MHKWKNVSGTFSIEVEYHHPSGSAVDINGKELECLTDLVGMQDMFELVIDFTSSGYYDPGCTYGPPENCYPPEGEAEEELDEAYLQEGSIIKSLSRETENKLFELYAEEISEVEIEDPKTGM